MFFPAIYDKRYDMNFFITALSQGLEFIAIILQLPSVLLMDISGLLLSLQGAMNNGGNAGEDE